MRGNDSDKWPERTLPSVGFKGILERVANQFTPNHDSQYQPGFIPANSPHLIQQTSTQERNHGRSMEPIGVNPDALYSTFSSMQEPFSPNHSAISRAASDLGSRLGSFSAEGFSGIDGSLHNTVENIEGSLFYPKNFSSIFQNSYSNVETPTTYGQNSSKTTSMQQLNSNFVHNLPPVQSSSNFSTNIMSSIGTWKDPYVQSNSLYEDNDAKYISGFVEGIRQERSSCLSPSSGLIIPDPGVPIDKNVDVQKGNLKLSYSDVLSKPPSANKNNHINLEAKSATKNVGTTGQTFPHKVKKETTSKHSFAHGKPRNRNAPHSTPTNNQKLAKMGIENFETVSIQQCDVESKTSDKKIDVHSATKCSNKSELQSSQSPLQARKVKDRKTPPDNYYNSSNIKDQLNNQAISSQKKQTPKRTSFINNVRSSTPPIVPLKKNNSEPFTKSGKSSVVAGYSDFLPNEVSYQTGNDNNNENSANVNEIGYAKDGASSSVRYRKAKMFRVTETKKMTSKKKTGACTVNNSEQLQAVWGLLRVWLCYVMDVVIWLYGIVIDVVQISYGLSIRFGKQWLEIGKSKGIELSTLLTSYWKSTKTYLGQKTWNRTGRNDKKKAGCLDNNIPLPTTGEAAMKRLLACRGKDPYNILGVTRTCSDEDIKKYYKRQAFLVHPDKNKQPGAEESFKILAHAFELIGESERRAKYDNRLNAEAQLESEWSEMSSLLTRLKEKLEESANTIRCTNCNKRHKRIKQTRPVYGARYCGDCRICHGAREGDIWAESYFFGIRWKYYACMEGAIYDITEWASCQKDNLKQLQANTHSVQYRIVSGKKTSNNRTSNPDGHTEPELEDFFNNYCRDKFSQGGQQAQSENRKRRGKRKK